MIGELCAPWPVQCYDTVTGATTALSEFALEAASEYLWEATGRRFGTCSVSLRPCRQSCFGGSAGLPWWDNGVVVSYPTPVLHGGVWYNIGCGCAGDCSCGTVSEITLPEHINQIVSISVDGVLLTGGVDYILYDGRRLTRVGAEWPLCQDWTVTGGPGTWVIEASFGESVPKLGEIAVGVLATEFLKACTNQPCQLPQQVVSVVRQGVSFSIADLDSLLEDGLTGLTIPDMFIRRYNRQLLQDRAHVIPLDGTLSRVQGI